MTTKKITTLFIITMLSLSEAYRILLVFPICSKSHNILAQGMVRHLVEAGHQVFHITCHPEKNPRENVTELDVSFIEERFMKQEDKAEPFKLKNLVGQTNFADSILFLYMTYVIHNEFIAEEIVVNFLSDKTQQFDVVFAEWMFSDLIAGIAPLYDCPLVWFSTTEAHWQVLRLIDEIPNPAYSVDVFSSNNAPLSFLERASELWRVLKKLFMINCIIVPLEMYTYYTSYASIAEKRGVTMPSYSDAVYNGSMMFFNSHPSLGKAMKLPQNALYIGGYHISNEVDPLPKDLQKFMDDAKDGVVYFSMGSNLRSVDMSDHMRESLMKMFSKLKQKVIWKFESELDNVPDNILLLKWAPQQSILAHPNTKMFITHGGQLSTTEAIHFGVPVVGIPVYGDQHVNMKSSQDKGFGLTVTLGEDMADDLHGAVQEILTNPSFKTKAMQLSAIYHNRPVHPGKELVHWINQVIETQGAPHLRSPALHVPFYQKAYIDLFAVVSILLYLLYKLKRIVTQLDLGFKKSGGKKVKKAKRS